MKNIGGTPVSIEGIPVIIRFKTTRAYTRSSSIIMY